MERKNYGEQTWKQVKCRSAADKSKIRYSRLEASYENCGCHTDTAHRPEAARRSSPRATSLALRSTCASLSLVSACVFFLFRWCLVPFITISLWKMKFHPFHVVFVLHCMQFEHVFPFGVFYPYMCLFLFQDFCPWFLGSISAWLCFFFCIFYFQVQYAFQSFYKALRRLIESPAASCGH